MWDGAEWKRVTRVMEGFGENEYEWEKCWVGRVLGGKFWVGRLLGGKSFGRCWWKKKKSCFSITVQEFAIQTTYTRTYISIINNNH